MKFAVVVLVVAGSLSCGPVCKQLAQRCHGNVAQLCGTDGRWRDVLDCSKMRRARVCDCSSPSCTCRAPR